MAAGQQLTLWLFDREDAALTRTLGFVSLSNIIRGAFESCHLGYEIDFRRIKGRPLRLAAIGWVVSLALAYSIGGLLAAIGIATGLAAVVAVVDPELVVLSGQVAQAGGEELRLRVKEEMTGLALPRPHLRISELDGDPILTGALRTALTQAGNDVQQREAGVRIARAQLERIGQNTAHVTRLRRRVQHVLDEEQDDHRPQRVPRVGKR